MTALPTSSGERPLDSRALRIEIDHDLARLAAVRQRKRRAVHRCDRLAHAIDAVIVELRFAQGLAAQRELQDRHARRVVADDERRLRARRHAAQDRLRHRRDLRDRGIDAHIWLKENANDRDTRQCLRLDVLYVIDRGRDGVLAEGRDLLRHLIGGEPTVLPDDRDHWNIDLGKDVRRRVLDRHHAKQHDQERHHDERVWAPKG